MYSLKIFEKQKLLYEKKGLNAWGINENAPNLVMAIREHLGSARIDTISLAIDNGTFQTCNHWYNSYNWMGRLASANGGKCSVIR